jgi:transcriptional regulator with XRE-family HTH domain
MDWRSILGDNILRLRIKQGWSQQDLAGEANLSLRFLAGVERGEENPSLDTLIAISSALTADPWELLKPIDK